MVNSWVTRRNADAVTLARLRHRPAGVVTFSVQRVGMDVPPTTMEDILRPKRKHVRKYYHDVTRSR